MMINPFTPPKPPNEITRKIQGASGRVYGHGLSTTVTLLGHELTQTEVDELLDSLIDWSMSAEGYSTQQKAHTDYLQTTCSKCGTEGAYKLPSMAPFCPTCITAAFNNIPTT